MGENDREGDFAYVLSTWLGAAHQLPQFRWLDRRIFGEHYNRLVWGALKRSQVIIACNPADEWHILGFLVVELLETREIRLPPTPALRENAPALVVHFVSVIENGRGKGIATALLAAVGLNAGPIPCTHYTERAFRGRLDYRPSLFVPRKGKHAPASERSSHPR